MVLRFFFRAVFSRCSAKKYTRIREYTAANQPVAKAFRYVLSMIAGAIDSRKLRRADLDQSSPPPVLGSWFLALSPRSPARGRSAPAQYLGQRGAAHVPC